MERHIVSPLLVPVLIHLAGARSRSVRVSASASASASASKIGTGTTTNASPLERFAQHKLFEPRLMKCINQWLFIPWQAFHCPEIPYAVAWNGIDDKLHYAIRDAFARTLDIRTIESNFKGIFFDQQVAYLRDDRMTVPKVNFCMYPGTRTLWAWDTMVDVGTGAQTKIPLMPRPLNRAVIHAATGSIYFTMNMSQQIYKWSDVSQPTTISQLNITRRATGVASLIVIAIDNKRDELYVFYVQLAEENHSAPSATETLVYGLDGTCLRVWPGWISRNIEDAAVNETAGHILIACMSSRAALQVFDRHGQPLYRFERTAQCLPWFFYPTFVSVHATTGRVAVVCGRSTRVFVFDWP